MIEKSRAPRKVAIADHLWDVFEQMAEEMGTDREGLINQAMFMFARLNGFLTPAAGAAAVERPGAGPAAVARVAPPPVSRASLLDDDEDDGPPIPPVRADAEARRREVEERVLETAAQLERQIKSREPAPLSPPPPSLSLHDQDDIDDDEIVDELMGEAGKKSLYIMGEDGELDKVDKDRFLMGRGKHCDFIVQSGKVSREHAVIVRDGDDYFIEDLGSSNGTWFQKKRIKRRKIEDGDEYYICSEKMKCVIR